MRKNKQNKKGWRKKEKEKGNEGEKKRRWEREQNKY